MLGSALFLLINSVCIVRDLRSKERQSASCSSKDGLVDVMALLSSFSSHKGSNDCCSWRGVTCSNRTHHVTMLDLHGYWSDDLGERVGLAGDINSTLLGLKKLQHLDLSFNSFTRIPDFIGSLRKLRYLNLSNIDYEVSKVPPQLGTEKSIHVLDLSYNMISGSLPDFSTFTALEELHLNSNKMSGYFTKKFEQISSLFVLDLADNQISGFLPNLSALSSLRELYFERNRLQGTLGEKIMPLTQLQFLGASSNLFHGTISETHMKNLSHLVYLDLSVNSLVLELGSDWSPNFLLDVISLSSCKLGPSFPTWLQTQKNFSIIDISNTQIDDSVPDWFWKLLTPNLRYLNVSFNKIHGSVPDLIYGDQPYFDLSSNNFLGPVPWFPSNTQTLVLSNNMFYGSISFVCNFTTIGRLDLSKNKLSGELPNCWMNLTRLFNLNLESNNLSGVIPTSIGFLSHIVMLSMRSNSLTGELPSSLQNCTLLQLLDVGENNLYGLIPVSIGGIMLE
ncbi:putative leucine-rich repeat protein [Tanacetum coccineum]